MLFASACGAVMVGLFMATGRAVGLIPLLLLAFFLLLSIGGNVLATPKDAKQAVRSSMAAMAINHTKAPLDEVTLSPQATSIKALKGSQVNIWNTANTRAP